MEEQNNPLEELPAMDTEHQLEPPEGGSQGGGQGAGGGMPDNPVTLPEVRMVSEINGEQVDFSAGFAVNVNATKDVNIQQGGGLMISAEQNAQVSYGGALMINAGHDANITNGGASMINVGGNVQMTNSGAGIMNIGGNVDLTNGAGVVMNTNNATVEDGFVGLLISSQTTLGEGSRVLLNTPQAIAFGAALGAVFALLSLIFRRK